MANIVSVDRERHVGKGWRRPGYTFAAANAVAPLVGSEFANAALAMPIGFIEQSGRYMPVAVMALAQGSNLLIGPNGQWIGKYVPAILRCYPFYLSRSEGKDEAILCVDEDSGLVVDEDGAENVEKFFEIDGKLSPTVNAVVEVLRQVEHDRTLTDLAVAALAEANVIKPWNLTVPVGDQRVTVSGLHRVDEAALNTLDDAAFLKLRKASALVIAYGQLISMGQTSMLAQLATIRQRMAQGAQEQPQEAPISQLPPGL
jgi:hypothetical protein